MAEDLYELARRAIAESRATADPDYPLFHVAPPVGRLNDPNGLVRYGERYHAFYQFSPLHPERLVYWGHASSTDLTTWESHGPALAPDSWYDRNGAYSGTALVLADGVAFHYSGNVIADDGTREAYQCRATTHDFSTFTKWAENPLIWGPPPGYTAHLRDPQVWQDADGSYRMCVGGQRENKTGCIVFYRSTDLQTWKFEGELAFPEATVPFDSYGYMWECPNFVHMLDEVTGVWRDVLIFSPQGIRPDNEGFENIFASCYLVGKLEGNNFCQTGKVYELDRGFEFYAPQVFARKMTAQDQPILMGWVGNSSEDFQPSMDNGWVHALTVARELRLRDGRLYQRPIVNAPASAVTTHADPTTPTVDALAALSGSRAFTADLDLAGGADGEWTLTIGTPASCVVLQASAGQLIIDRSKTRYPHGSVRQLRLPAGDRLRVQLVHDRSVTEVFLNDGQVAFSMRSYLDADACGLSFTQGHGVSVESLRMVRFD